MNGTTGRQRIKKDRWGMVILLLGVVFLAAAVAAAVKWVPSDKPRPRQAPAVASQPPRPAGVEQSVAGGQSEERIKVTLFFESADALLAPEVREVPRVSFDTVAQARGILEALFAGPRDPSLKIVWPPGTQAGPLFLLGKNELVVSVEWGRGEESGRRTETIWGEYLALGSLVDTLLVNLPELSQVRVVVAGVEQETLAGHVDIRRPYGRIEDLIERLPIGENAPPAPAGEAKM